jgi:ATP-dependent exoDNAse (exonuclease V) beta subunit
VEAGDLLHAIDRVRQVVEEGHSLAAAAAALEADREASSEVESLPLEPGQSDVVRVMNLHKAKGLEAPVVFLADPCGGFKPRVDVRIIRDGLTARGYFDITTDWGYSEKVLAEPVGWEQFKQEEQDYLAAEESRLLYVAATRARDLCSGVRDSGRRSRPGACSVVVRHVRDGRSATHRKDRAVSRR